MHVIRQFGLVTLDLYLEGESGSSGVTVLVQKALSLITALRGKLKVYMSRLFNDWWHTFRVFRSYQLNFLLGYLFSIINLTSNFYYRQNSTWNWNLVSEVFNETLVKRC